MTGGVWKDTVGVIQSINESKQMRTINVDLFGRETPVEIGFAEIKAKCRPKSESYCGASAEWEGELPQLPQGGA